MLKTYKVTKTAPKKISGARNPGEGKPIELTAEQAEHPLRLGHITDPSANSKTSAKKSK